MSLYGPEISLVSLGCSCQSARQLDDNREYIEGLLGKGALLERRGGYFDSLITPIETVISFVENDIPALSSFAELQRGKGSFWPRGDLWFYHYFKDVDDSPNAPAEHADSAKVSYLRERFLRPTGPTIFAISNTQNNLDRFCHERSFEELFVFTSDRLGRLRSALDRRFGVAFMGLLVVENATTRRSEAVLPKVVRQVAETDGTEWKGNSGAWQEACGRAIAELVPARSA